MTVTRAKCGRVVMEAEEPAMTSFSVASSAIPSETQIHGRWSAAIQPAGTVPEQIRVLICDNLSLVRSGLRLLLHAEADIHVVEEATGAAEAVRGARMEKPDVVLLGLFITGISALEVIPQIRAAAPNTKVLILSMHDDPSDVREAFARGANGYIPKDDAVADLVTAVRQVASGHRYVHHGLGARLASSEAAANARDPGLLSHREQEVLRLLALGNTNKEIAETLHISVRTSETHRAHIMQKLHLANRAELVATQFRPG